MGKIVDFNNRDRFIQIGIAISTLRKLRGMSQEELAVKANMSRTHLSNIEAPNVAYSFSLDTFFNIADALGVEPTELLGASMVPEKMLSAKKKEST